eukprot:scaffold289732_cov35-Tisochrysis_lutea.AAC.4
MGKAMASRSAAVALAWSCLRLLISTCSRKRPRCHDEAKAPCTPMWDYEVWGTGNRGGAGDATARARLVGEVVRAGLRGAHHCDTKHGYCEVPQHDGDDLCGLNPYHTLDGRDELLGNDKEHNDRPQPRRDGQQRGDEASQKGHRWPEDFIEGRLRHPLAGLRTVGEGARRLVAPALWHHEEREHRKSKGNHTDQHRAGRKHIGYRGGVLALEVHFQHIDEACVHAAAYEARHGEDAHERALGPRARYFLLVHELVRHTRSSRGVKSKPQVAHGLLARACVPQRNLSKTARGEEDEQVGEPIGEQAEDVPLANDLTGERAVGTDRREHQGGARAAHARRARRCRAEHTHVNRSQCGELLHTPHLVDGKLVLLCKVQGNHERLDDGVCSEPQHSRREGILGCAMAQPSPAKRAANHQRHRLQPKRPPKRFG